MQIQTVAQQRHRHAVRRMHALRHQRPRHHRGRGAQLDGAEPALGARAARPSSRGWTTPTRCSASCRAACSRTCAKSRWTQLVGDGLPRLRDRRRQRRRAQGRDAAHHGAHAAPAAGAQAALPDGRGHAGRPGRRRGAGRRHVRLRDADAQCAQRHAVHALRRPEDAQRAPQERPAAARRSCTCHACAGASGVPWNDGGRDGFSRAYLHHLDRCGEMLGADAGHASTTCTTT